MNVNSLANNQEILLYAENRLSCFSRIEYNRFFQIKF